MSLKSKVQSGISLAFSLTSTLTGPGSVIKNTSSYDPSTDETSVTSVETTIKYVYDDSKESGLNTHDIVEGLRVVYVLSSVTPEMDDSFKDAVGDTYTILSVNTIITYDEAFLYKLIVRR